MGKSGTFGDRLLQFRKRSRITQRELSEAMRVDFTYVSKIESGNAPPPARDKIDLAAKRLSLTDDERAELYGLAEKIPTDVEKLLSKQPAAFRLLRSITQSPIERQEEILEKLIKQVEASRRRHAS